MPLERLGPYRIEELLGRGGMGAVYVGVHTETGERSAIKVLSEALAYDPRFRERFRGEVETLKRLRHRNIVTLHGYGEEAGRLFFVMELIDGTGLDAELREGKRFSWRETAEIGIQVCAALKHAHDHGVIHRDLKPANLLRDREGTVKLTDFGIAKLFGAADLTLAGGMIGTPDYMSPEQAEGHAATSRSDLFSLGGVLYTLLTGRPPFAGDSVTHVLDRLRTRDPLPVSALAPETPEAMEQIIGQLLQKDPRQRIATPQLLSNLLQAMLHALPPGESRKETVAEASAEPEPDRTAEETAAGDRPPAAGSDARQAPRSPGRPHPGSSQQPTEASRAGPDTDQRETVQYTLEPEAASSEQDEPGTHFTVVNEGDYRASLAAADDKARKLNDWKSITGMTLALAALVATIVYALLPPSADDLFGRIQQMSRQENPGANYAEVLEDFLRRFPDDPRAATVAELQDLADAAWLRDQLQNKLRSLTDLEQAYLAGMRHVDREAWDAARDAFRQIIEGLEGRELSPADRRLEERAAIMLEEIDRREASGTLRRKSAAG